MSLSVASMQDFFFEVTDTGSFDQLDPSATSFQLTVNRVSQNDGTNDFVSSTHVSADNGKLPKTKISINIPDGTTDLNAYFDASFSITVTALVGSTAKLTETKLAKYILPPQPDTIGDVVVTTEQDTIKVTAQLKDPSFNIDGLVYHIQIDGPNSTGAYVSRNHYQARDASGNLTFDSSDAEITNIVNGKWYDVAVIAFNATGSTGVVEHVFARRVSQDANSPTGSVVSNRFNSASSDGRLELNLSSTGTKVTNDPDRKYKIEVARSDASNVILSQYTATVDASFDLATDSNSDVTHTITGLTPNVLYNIHVSAINSTLNASQPHKILDQRPEALPSGLKILEIRTGLLADELDPSGKLLVRLDRANFKPNGEDVSLNYYVKELTGSETASEVVNAMTNAANYSDSVEYLLPFYGYGGELIDNAFRISGLENNKFHMVGVRAVNQDPNGANLTALWYGMNGTGGQINATNTPKPITKPQAPIFDNNTDSSGVHPILNEASELLSGQVRGTIVLPDYEISGNVPEYTQYKMFVEDLSGQDVAGKSVTVNILNTEYLELGTKFTHENGSSVIVSADDSLKGYQQGAVNVQNSSDNSWPKYSEYVNDPSWSITAENQIWLDENGTTELRTDASFSQVFSGLDNGKQYKIKAQLILNGLESSIVAASKTVVPSAKPQLDTGLGNKVAGIFDVTKGTILDPSTNDVAFTSSGINDLLVNSNNGGYEIDKLIVAFVYSFTTGTGEVIKQIHEQYEVSVNDASIDNSFNYPSEDLNGSRTYSVYVTPQNGVYNDESYNSFAELEAVPGSVLLTSLRLDSKILDISSSVIRMDPLNSTIIKIDGQLEQGNGNMTVLKRIEGKLIAKPPQWDGDDFDTPMAESYNDVTNFDLSLNNGVDANGVFTKTFEVLKDKYGWEHEVKLEVISRPNDDAFDVEYSSQGVEKTNLIAGKKPTIILEDVSKVTILPNGFETTVTEIELSGNDLATISKVEPSQNAAMNVKFNTFYDENNNLVSLDDTDSNYAVVDGVENTFYINDAVNLQTSAHNAKGRTTLFSEKTFTVVVESGNASLVASGNDGKFVLRPSGGDITFRLDIA